MTKTEEEGHKKNEESRRQTTTKTREWRCVQYRANGESRTMRGTHVRVPQRESKYPRTFPHSQSSLRMHVAGFSLSLRVCSGFHYISPPPTKSVTCYAMPSKTG